MARLINDVNAKMSDIITNGFSFMEGAEYKVAVAAAENGTVVVSATEAKAGATVTITPTPAEGYQVDTVTVTAGEDEVEVTEAEGVYSFVMPAANVEVAATFAAIPTYAVTIAATENGTATANKESAAEGESVEVTVTPADGYQVGTVTVMAGDTEVETTEAEGVYTFTMPAAAVEVTATFTAL